MMSLLVHGNENYLNEFFARQQFRNCHCATCAPCDNFSISYFINIKSRRNNMRNCHINGNKFGTTPMYSSCNSQIFLVIIYSVSHILWNSYLKYVSAIWNGSYFVFYRFKYFRNVGLNRMSPNGFYHVS